jgi:hypothetical protein
MGRTALHLIDRTVSHVRPRLVPSVSSCNPTVCVMLTGAKRRVYVSGSVDSNANCSNPADAGQIYAFQSPM